MQLLSLSRYIVEVEVKVELMQRKLFKVDNRNVTSLFYPGDERNLVEINYFGILMRNVITA